MREGDDGTMVRAIEGTDGKAVRSIFVAAVGVNIEDPLEGGVVGFREGPLDEVVVGFREGPLEGVAEGFREGPLEGAVGLREGPLEGVVVGFRIVVVVGFRVGPKGGASNDSTAEGTTKIDLTALNFVEGILEYCLLFVGAAVGVIEGSVFPWVKTAALSSSRKFKTVDDFDVIDCVSKEQLGGRRGLQSLLILSHCPEQHEWLHYII